ncbi:hypothetical protein WKK05_11965 [Nostoc sp. UHCC 0302]|uniref:hypothetical protein n=1 Tax=Nostoc sp. UHCC 0302 TaxID=3134896 RepID=UPI00311CC625
MEMKLSTLEIRAILQGCQYTLRLVGSSKDYRQLQGSPDFSTSNDTVLNNVVNTLGELIEAIDDVEQLTGESEHGIRT